MMNRNITDTKFDLIISNPPYKYGNEIIKNSLNAIREKAVILMPAAKYKADRLFSHIQTIELADKNFFKDKKQDIKPDLSIAVCVPNPNDAEITFETVMDSLLPEDVAQFLNLNRKLTKKYDRLTYMKSMREKVSGNKEYFMVPYWQHVGCAKSEKSVTRKYNFGDTDAINKVLNSDMCYSVLKFPNPNYWNNFFNWYYKNDIQDYILLNCCDLLYPSYIWFPQIDFSIDRDYANLTFSQLLEIMFLEL